MNLYSLTFIYLFLPASLLVYSLTPAFGKTPMRSKNAVLLLLSLVFYLLAEPRYLPLLAGSVLVDYACCRLMERFKGREPLRRGLMAVVVVKNLLGVVLISSFSQNREIWKPLGLMICLVTSLGYVLDVYRGEAECEHNLIDFGLFCFLFCKLPTGPLVRWNQMAGQLRERKLTLAQVGSGLGLYIQGLAKKVLIGNSMTALYEQLRLLDRSLVSGWMMTAALAFAIYFNLSSLCDMARGLAKLFAIELPRNFYYPYQSRSVTEFVGRFNITVTEFLSACLRHDRPNEREGSYAMVLRIGVMTLLWGAWFGFRVNFLIWGLYFVLFQLLEKLALGALLEKIPTLFARMYTFAVVLISFVIFAGTSVDQSLGYIGAMLGMTQTYTVSAMYIVSSNYVLMLIAFVLCTSLGHSFFRWLHRRAPTLGGVLEVVLNAVLLVLSTAFLMV